MDSKDIDYDFLKYGTYSEEDFDRCLKSCSRAIIVGRPETQGIAYQEMMSSGMPLLLWEVDEWYDMGVPEPYQKYPEPTLAHYFSDECGMKFYSVEELESSFDTFMNTEYDPKSYVKRELSYKVTVQKLLALFE